MANNYDNSRIFITVKTFQEHRVRMVAPLTICLAGQILLPSESLAVTCNSDAATLAEVLEPDRRVFFSLPFFVFRTSAFSTCPLSNLTAVHAFLVMC